jgi:hypothetical protein
MQATAPAVFQKAVLSVGTYHSPDGQVKVTPGRLRHWANEISRLQRSGYSVPMHWDHAELNDVEMLGPVATAELASRKSRSAAATVGKLERFTVAKDGKSAEILIRPLTDAAAKHVSNNAVSVSPVIFPSWKDGRGQQYRDVITSFDFVNHPVDYSQGEFKPVSRMGLKVSRGVIRMGVTVQRLGKDGKPTDDDEASDDVLDGGSGAGDDTGDDDTPDFNADDSDTVGDDTDEAGTDYDEFDANANDDQAPIDDIASMSDVLDALKQLQIVLPQDTTPANFIERLRPALLTAVAQSGSVAPSPSLDDENDATQEGATMVDPQIATMSLAVRQRLEHADKQHQKSVAERLKTLLNDGKCTPHEHNQREQLVGRVRLSLDSRGNPKQSTLESWIESREVIPKGTFWDSETKTKRMGIAEIEAKTTFSPQSKDVAEAIKALGGDPSKQRRY